jgi:hypothetical protein
MRRVFIVFSVLIVAGLVQAQSVPDFVNYQGRLTDESGAPLATGDYKLRFEVHDDPIAGSRVWGPLCFDKVPPEGLGTGHRYVVPVVQGYFNVVLGEDTGVTDCATPPGVVGAPVSTAFTADSRFVEVAVFNETGEVWEPILPRQQVLSSPYAVSADRAREVVSAEGQPTRIACKTGPSTEEDIVTVSASGVGMQGAVGITGPVTIDGAVGITGPLGMTGNLDVTGDLQVVSGTTSLEKWADEEQEANGWALMGGIKLIWGTGESNTDGDQTFSFPGTGFDGACGAVTVSLGGEVTAVTKTNFVFNRLDAYPGSKTIWYMAVGY